MERGVILRPHELNFKAEEKVKVSPIGEVVGIDGRAFKIDAPSIIATIQKNGLDIPLDEDHLGGRAMGWLGRESFEIRGDGIYATLSLNEEGERLIKDKSYRYLSPVYYLDSNRNVLGLDSVGLVNRPNLLNQSLNHQTTPKENRMDEVKQLLEATQKELGEKNSALSAKEQELAALKEENKKLQSALREQKIEGAIKAGELLPNKREFAMTLENNAQLDQFLAVSKSDMEHLKQATPAVEKNSGEGVENSDVYKSVALQLEI